MHILLAVLTFAFFAGLDWFLSRRHAAASEATPTPALAPVPAPAGPLPRLEPVWVAGYELPEDLHYHPGHTWARVVGPDTVAVGLDDFARRLVGTGKSVKVPTEGHWLRQGAPGVEIENEDGRVAALVCPVEGEVVAVNPELRADPRAATDDPYGRGWLFKIRSSALATNLKNLFSGSLAQRWTEDARDRLEHRLMAVSGSVLQDGGEPAHDFARYLETEDWEMCADAFFLSEGRTR